MKGLEILSTIQYAAHKNGKSSSDFYRGTCRRRLHCTFNVRQCFPHSLCLLLCKAIKRRLGCSFRYFWPFKDGGEGLFQLCPKHFFVIYSWLVRPFICPSQSCHINNAGYLVLYLQHGYFLVSSTRFFY